MRGQRGENRKGRAKKQCLSQKPEQNEEEERRISGIKKNVS